MNTTEYKTPYSARLYRLPNFVPTKGEPRAIRYPNRTSPQASWQLTPGRNGKGFLHFIHSTIRLLQSSRTILNATRLLGTLSHPETFRENCIILILPYRGYGSRYTHTRYRPYAPWLYLQTEDILCVASAEDCRCFLRVVLQYTFTDPLLLPGNKQSRHL